MMRFGAGVMDLEFLAIRALSFGGAFALVGLAMGMLDHG